MTTLLPGKRKLKPIFRRNQFCLLGSSISIKLGWNKTHIPFQETWRPCHGAQSEKHIYSTSVGTHHCLGTAATGTMESISICFTWATPALWESRSLPNPYHGSAVGLVRTPLRRRAFSCILHIKYTWYRAGKRNCCNGAGGGSKTQAYVIERPL